MKKIFIALVTAVLLFLDWTALSDILKGEQNLLAEYVTLAGSVVIIAAMLSYVLHQKKQLQKNK